MKSYLSKQLKINPLLRVLLWVLGATLGVHAQSPGGVSSGLAHWVRADKSVYSDAGITLATAGQTVQQMNDRSGNGLHVTAVSAAQKPILLGGTTQTNFNPSLDFNSDYLINLSRVVQTTDGVSMYSVGSTRVLSGVRTMYSLGTNGNEPTVDLQSTLISPYNTGSSPSNVDIFNNQMTLNQSMIWGLRAANNVANDLKFSFQGEELATTLEILSSSSAYGNKVHVGTGVDSPWNGLIMEGITYNRSLTGAEAQRVNSYLALKYGITLRTVDNDASITEGNYVSSAGTVIWNKTANSAYHNNVTGIGRDDASELVQKQSRSINTEALVTFGVGTGIAASNALNSNSFSADASFEVIGDNGLSTAYATAYLPQTYVSPVPSGFKIMSRIWKVQETGTVGTVTISVPASTKAEVLLVSSSATFTPGSATEITLAPDGNGNLTAQVNLTDGQFFTFGATLVAPGAVISNLKTWYKADAGVTGTTAVTAWADQFNTYHVTQATASHQPSLAPASTAFNYNPSLSFSGTDQLEYKAGRFMTTTSSGTMFGAASNTLDGGYENLGDIGIDNPHMGTLVNQQIMWMNTSSPVRIDHPTLLTKDKTHLLGYFWNGGSPNVGSGLRQDGVEYYNATTEATGVGNSGVVDGMWTIGGYQYVENWHGNIAEIILYDRNLTSTEKDKVETYMAVKYGTTLSHNYLSAAGTTIYDVSSYQNNIAGIGRDNAQGLYQKQSRSINTGFQPAIALGSSIATSNALNAGTIATDASFMVWGSSTGATGYAVNVTSPNVNARMARVWKVKKTNWTDQSVTIHINDPQAQYLLIQNSDPTFATITQEIALTNGAATINSSLLPDGAYFTFARQVFPPGGVATNLNFWIIGEEGSLTGGIPSTDGQQIEKVLDKANGGEAFNDVVADQPTYQSEAGDQLNFHHTMRFGSNGAFLKTTTDVDKDKFDNFAVFTVFKAPPASFGNSSLWGNADGAFQRFSLVNGTKRTWCSPCTDFTNVVTPGNWYIASDMVDNTGATNATQFFTSGKFSGQVTNTSGLSSAPLYIARRGLITDFFYGDMTEVIVYGIKAGATPVMAAAQRKSIESYLAIKYGITLDQSTSQDYLASDQTTKMWDAAANGAYKFDITGIGRDDFGNLNQKQSKSVNADNLITIGVGSALATDNESNTGTFPNDKSFLTWANNDASAAFSVSVAGGTSTLRLGRVWKADKTNWSDQDITLCYAGGGKNRALLISTDPTFATFTQELPLNANGCVTFNSSLLSDGVYFTIGGVLSGPGCVNADLQLWLKADEGVNTAFGTDIESWFDQSLNGHHPEAVNEPFKVTSGSNFNPVIRFDGTDDYFNWPANFTNGWTAGEVFYMLKSNRATNVSNGFATWGNNHWQHYTWGTQLIFDAFGSTTRQTFNPSWDIQQYGVYQTMAKAGQWTAWHNGNQEFNDATNTVRFNEAATNLGFGNLTYFSGDIGEVILYNRELTAPEKQRVNSYLGVKYGLTLAHDYLSGTGTTIYPIAGYNKNIAGIGRDDCQSLIQKQSKSSNTGALLTMGIDNLIGTDNATHSGAFDTNASFLMWGDNGVAGTVALPAESPTQCGPPPTADKRLGAIWKVVETGTVESAKLSIDLSGAGFSADYPVYMLVSSDAAFTSYNSILLTAAGANSYTANFNFDGTKYITFAGNTTPPANLCEGNKTLSWWRYTWPWTTKTKNYDIGDQRIAVTVTDPSSVGYLFNWYPVSYGRSLYIPRNDNNEAAKITTKFQLLDVTNPANKKPASGVSFTIYRVDGWWWGKDVVNVYGKLNGVTVSPKLSRAKYTDITLNSATQATSNIYWRGWSQWGKLYVNFDTPVDEIYVEYSKDNQYSFKVFNDIAIGDLSITCKPPVPEVATPDNVYLYKEVSPNPGLTEEAFTYKFTVQNLNCDAQTINLNDVLPAGLTWVDSSLATSLTVGTTNGYGGTNTLALGNITVPKGTSYIYMDAISANTGTFTNQASFVINGNTYLSDEPSVPGADSPTPITIDQNDPLANISIEKTVDKATTGQNTEVTYTYKITNNEGSPVKIILQDNLQQKAQYVAASMTGVPGSALVSAYANESSFTIRDLDVPGAGAETVIAVKANVKDTEIDSTLYNFATYTPDGSTSYRQVEVVSNTVKTKITAPPGSFTFGNCTNATVSGTFTANGTAGQTGTLTIPITGAVAGSVSITITATDFAASPAPFEVTITAGQTSIAIPITYTGAGVAGIRTLTVTSAEATGSCAPNVTVIALIDTDGDGIPDTTDTDDDGDGLTDATDPKPLDTDNDGANNDVDTDDDGDGILDVNEQAGQGLDTDNDGTPNATDTDDDNDGILDSVEQGTLVGGVYTLPDSDGDGTPDLADALDTDGDGIPDTTDTDDDNDGLSDTQDPKPLDTDNDGTNNSTDTDDDGDGILDAAEAPGQGLDTDNDGTPNATDTDDDNDGILDSVEQGTLVGGVYTLPDGDGDGIPDLADALDTDGDGIADNVDTDDDGDGLTDATDPKPLDTDNDGTNNSTDTDDDGDGILDAAEAPGQALDTDNDGTPNATDTDDDNDGILDSVEQGTLVGGVYTLPDSDGDGIPDLADALDTDGDGVADNVDTDDDGDGLSDAQDPKPLDTDNDGTNNDVDTDDDGDGILDAAEAPGQGLDTDNDGTPNATDTDDDNDGILDSVEQGTLVGGVYTLPDSDDDGIPDLADALDTDGDGTPDMTDTDDDGDGIPDASDANPLDTDNDGTPNATDLDDDGDGLLDTQDPKLLDTDNDGQKNDVDPDDDGDGILDAAEQPGKGLDSDNDGTGNETDTDDDNDGILDSIEQGTLVGGFYTLPDSDGDGLPDLADGVNDTLDTDGDGTPNSTDTDDDNDGLSDATDKFPLDTDNDGINNDVDTDDDGDGIVDVAEQAGQALDTDNDGTPNATDTDDDNDGILDSAEIGVLDGTGKYTLPDGDGDGLPDLADALNLDVDGDGIPNATDPDMDGDGINNIYDTDVDGDGIPNATDTDDDGDGTPDTTDTVQPNDADGFGTPGNNDGDATPDASDFDLDGDGTLNDVDLDTDNDGIPNATDTDDDGDGTPDATDTTPQGPVALDTDGDGIPDTTDTDDDNDGLSDTQDPKPLDTDNDGTNNSTDTDDDGDGILDAAEAPGQALDTDNDGTPNATDTDDDNDGILDSVEQGTLVGGVYTLPDIDGDGIPDLADALDTDGDGTPDMTDTDDDGDGIPDASDANPLDTDNDGTPNATDPDDDGDGLLDTQDSKLLDTDNDGQKNDVDPDDDGDGILDAAEQPGKGLDSDNDGTGNETDTDDDGDGIADSIEQGVLVGGFYTLPDSDGDGLPDLADGVNDTLDTDGDGTPNSTDTDDDNDGLSDATDKFPLDTDNDGTNNDVDTDDDGDGIVDVAEQAGQALDTDNDGTPNATDTDDDNDGILDSAEIGVLDGTGKYTLPDGDGDGLPDLADALNLDVDGDGIPNSTDPDMDGDGINNIYDTDVDGDGLPNATDTDDDGDGTPDATDTTQPNDADGFGTPGNNDGDATPDASDFDLDGDGTLNDVDLDTDNDGIPNTTDTDDDGDGTPDATDSTPQGPIASDVDGDGIPNATDPDMDGDGINNIYDTDVDGDGLPNATDTDDDGDGTPDATDTTQPNDADGFGTPGNNDGDATPDASDFDLDGDGTLNDVDLDTDNDGIPNTTDTDDDGDGTPDATDMTPQGPSASDVDGDGIPNATDPDMDGDGINNIYDTDVDGDGLPNATDTDDDGDGTPDATDTTQPNDADGFGTPGNNDGDATPDASDFDLDGDGTLNDVDLDTDNDGIPNATDTDDDGDGTPDATDMTPQGPSASDVDGDGIPNSTDPDMDGDGINNIYDTDVDGDGLPNATDTDDDGDGTPDATDTAQPNDADGFGTPGNNDGDATPDASDYDLDGDGLANNVDPDVDNDGIPNTTDTDDDGDGTPDATDMTPQGPSASDVDGDGIPNSTDPDMDGDGINNIYDTDVDGDGLPNATDTDDDGDGTPDATDTTQPNDADGFGTPGNNDGDATPDASDYDLDGDGLANNVDPDVDNDGIPNTTDTDDDGDGTPDATDMTPQGPSASDVDGDGIPNSTDPDMDGDGINNIYDTDVDGDGLPNATDTDDDGDGTPDATDTAQPNDADGFGTPGNNDGDATPDASDFDLDGDGTLNDVDLDTDNDGIPNATDTDDDGDGTPDATDSTPQGPIASDVDGDGIPNATDPDMDGDGINNIYDTDVDGDGLPNATDTDDDGDGTPDATDTAQPNDADGFGTPGNNDGDATPDASDFDLDGDGLANNVDPDVDNDGIPNTTDTDDDGDGTPDATDMTPQGPSASDVDGDGIPNATDPDMDGDGINNIYDTDVDGDGLPNATDTDDDGDGTPDATDTAQPNDADGFGTPGNNDGDAIPDASDFDLDGDGTLNDVDLDTDNDGIPNATDTDDDGDGTPDATDSTPQGPIATDVDGDGIPNATDPDMDGDGINNIYDTDVDGDGLPNATDTDDDGDGTPDATDTTQPNDADGFGTPGNNDGDATPDASDYDLDGDGLANNVDPDVDNDGIPNTTDTDDDGDGTPDAADSTPQGPIATDVDGDGIPNSTDPDMDGDGINNIYDTDVDGDGLPNATDTDDDGDGTPDATDTTQPNDADGFGTPGNNDGDATPDASDYDLDGDGLANNVDPDVDNDGIPNTTDTDDDGDGTLDGADTTPQGPSASDIDLFPNATFGSMTFNVGDSKMVVININEIKNNPTTGTITFFVPSATGFTFGFDPTLTTTTVVVAEMVNNNDWTVLDTGTGLLFTSKPGVVIPAGGRSRVALSVTANTAGTTATITTNITPNSGGDANSNNNVSVVSMSVQN